MGIILDLLSIFVNSPFRKVNESDIGRNIKELKKHQWFRNYLNEEKHRELIIHNKDVRQVIGKFKSEKLDRDYYQEKCQKKLKKVSLKN
ncbi:hypothetical protein [Aquibacillus rhizosphaerae]|uniref:Uncharacterized protein n=1 Tax=Aquibacillus rhizosphaerae TaxID=3051431 RepID=A0ABT7L0I4_9BACI|nr:hypothetical protein [Aquibacillus sp. LR5S19]MDL4839337.1 hypothetical protein [Aquibacillus sp. LR5S19]